MKSSTKDKVEGAVKEATGKLKEKVGEAMGDPGCAIAEPQNSAVLKIKTLTKRLHALLILVF